VSGMHRSWLRRSAPRSGWRHTARAAASRRVVEAPLGPPALVEPDPAQSLSDGLIIESSLLARLLGVKLLTLEGTIVLSPAHVRLGVPPLRAGSQSAHDGLPLRPAEIGRAPVAVSARIGSGLADAVRLLDESAAELDATTKPRS
jgi:hypothetical protein